MIFEIGYRSFRSQITLKISSTIAVRKFEADDLRSYGGMLPKSYPFSIVKIRFFPLVVWEAFSNPFECPFVPILQPFLWNSIHALGNLPKRDCSINGLILLMDFS